MFEILSMSAFINSQDSILSYMNRVNLKKLDHLEKSFMNIRNNKGPCIEH